MQIHPCATRTALCQLLDTRTPLRGGRSTHHRLAGLSKAFYSQGRQVKRFHMWQEAKWGVVLGATATAAAALIALPVLL